MMSEPLVLPGFLPPDLARSLAGGERLTTPVAGVNVVWHAWGDAQQPTLVLLHGGSGSWTHWVRNIAPLRDAGWRVLAVDLPGFGDSDLPPGATDVNHITPYLHAGLQQLHPVGPVHLVGFSFGGMAAALWLAESPNDAQSLVLVGAPGLGLNVAQRVPLKGWRHLPNAQQQADVHRYNLMALMLHHPESLNPLALALHSANVQRDRMPRRRLSSTPIVAEALPRVQAKVSAIYGEHDALYLQRLPEVHLALAQSCRAWGLWVTVPDAGHWVPFEAAQAFNTALLGQFDGV